METELHQRNGQQSIEDTKEVENNEIQDDTNALNNLSWTQKFHVFISNITVEPLVACYVLPSVLASLAVQNLNLEKACRVNKHYSDEICDGLIRQTFTNKTIEEVEVQSLVAYMGAWRLPLTTALPAIMILFIGSWSDRTGKRKPCMLVPMLGELLTAIGLMLCTYYFLQWPLEVAGVIEALPPSLTGGHPMMFMGIFSFLADHTTKEERTFRIGVVNIFISLAIPIGTALSGILLYSIGFYGVFSISASFYVVGFIYGYMRIKDIRKPKDQNIGKGKKECYEFIHYKHVVDTFKVLIRKRPGTKRLQCILLIITYIVVAGPTHGSGHIIYLYARRNFGFSEIDFSIFSSYTILVNFFGVMFALTLFSKHYQMNDSLLAALACISKVIASFVYAFAPSRGWLYLGPIIELIGGTAIIAMRSLATKLVEPDEIAKICSLFGVSEAIVNAVYSPIFSAFYVATLATFPGAFCLLGALMIVPSIFIFLILYKLDKAGTEEKHQKGQKAEDNNDKVVFDDEITPL